ncbi:MAG: VWA domain-containing protein, partial [Pirellulaceae bacterium]|nr:VWA domain-containing protein [Pirellulaceae bacterium]
MKRLLSLAFALTALVWAAPVLAQGILIIHNHPHPVPLPRPIFVPQPAPPPPVSYSIKELAVQARVNDQIAQVQVSQSFVNTGSRQMEVSFVFPLPYEGAIDQLTLMVDGKEYPAKLLPAKEARAIYEGYIRRNQDPALLEWIGTGMFQTSVFPVPPGAERKVTLRFSQLLRKDHQLTDFLYPLSTAKYTSKPVERVAFDVSIESSQEIKSVYSPTHSIDIKRPDAKHAIVKYEGRHEVPTADFRLFFDTAKTKLGASVLSFRPDAGDDGYFLLLASPQLKAKESERTPKTVVLVVDRSGSMSGKKLEQAKDALKFVLNNLHEQDLFNIVAYDSSVESFRPELQRYDDQTRDAALGFVEGIYAGGSTNIDGALTAALKMLHDSTRPSYVVFLTDGLPTAGETNETKIVESARKQNDLRARLISFGVGYDVNSRLLDRLSRANHGQSEFVRPDENIEVHVSRLYSRISSPVMTEVAVEFDVEGAKVEQGQAVNRVYPREMGDLFAGEQLVLVGRYKHPGQAKVVIRGQIGSNTQKFDFPATLVQSSGDETYGFVEKLWAMRRVGEIIDELDLKGKNQELIDELVALSTRHGILTPYTSFLADDQAPARELAAGISGEQARRALDRLDEAEGRAAFAQRSEKKRLQESLQVPAGG